VVAQMSPHIKWVVKPKVVHLFPIRVVNQLPVAVADCKVQCEDLEFQVGNFFLALHPMCKAVSPLA
jgi:hypothetical protein